MIFPDDARIGKTLFKQQPEYFANQFVKAGILDRVNALKAKKYTYADLLIERLKGGRGSAIKGQFRGRYLEDFVEAIIAKLAVTYASRCNFIGKDGNYIAKADFAIPNAGNPNIVIEVKAYGATGSKQTDSIGDVEKILKHKRHDTYFIFVTDGITWLDRLSDLSKLIKYQNEGPIYRIYTQAMSVELEEDLSAMLQELNLVK